MTTAFQYLSHEFIPLMSAFSNRTQMIFSFSSVGGAPVYACRKKEGKTDAAKTWTTLRNNTKGCKTYLQHCISICIFNQALPVAFLVSNQCTSSINKTDKIRDRLWKYLAFVFSVVFQCCMLIANNVVVYSVKKWIKKKRGKLPEVLHPAERSQHSPCKTAPCKNKKLITNVQNALELHPNINA